MPDQHAKSTWDKRYKQRGMVSPLDFTRKALSYLSPDMSLLDIGCGDGRDSLFFAQHDIHVTAIDFSEEAVKRLTTLNPDIDAHVMDILSMNFPDENFDAIYAHLSIHYFDDATTDKVIANIYRMLKPEGFFFVKCKSPDDPLYGQGEEIAKDMYRKEYDRHFFSVEYMAEKLKDFQVIELASSQAEYDGHFSAFAEAIATK